MAPKRGKTYRTSSGKQVDFGALLLDNETVPALGNMNVNARGDEIAPDGTITKSREEIMREYNALNTMIPQDGDIPEGTGLEADDDWQDWEPPVTSQGQDSSEATVAQVEESRDKVVDKTVKTSTGGLAAAVAAAKKTTEE